MNNLVQQLLEGKKAKELLSAEAKKKSRYPHEISFRVTEDGKDAIIPLLLALMALGNLGSSRKIEIEDGEKSFFWDGDGNAKMADLTLNGEPVQKMQEPPREKGAPTAGRSAQPPISQSPGEEQEDTFNSEDTLNSQ